MAQTAEMAEVNVPLLDTVDKDLRGTNNPKDTALANAILAARELHGGEDIFHKVSIPFVGANNETMLYLAAGQYNRIPTQEYLGELNQAFWTHYGGLMGVSSRNIAVPQAPFDDQEINDFRNADEPDMGLFVPEIVADVDGLPLLGKAFREMSCWVLQEGHGIRNVYVLKGWGVTEASLESPYRTNQKGEITGLTEAVLRKLIEEDRKRQGLTVNVFPIASRMNEHTTGKNFDLHTDSRLLGSLGDGGVLSATFYEDGDVGAFSGLDAQGDFPSLGGRSWGAKP